MHDADNPCSILVIDCNQDIAELITLSLRTHHFDVCIAQSEKEANYLVTDAGLDPDIVLADDATVSEEFLLHLSMLRPSARMCLMSGGRAYLSAPVIGGTSIPVFTKPFSSLEMLAQRLKDISRFAIDGAAEHPSADSALFGRS